MKMLAPKAVGSASEAWVTPELAHVRASAHPNRVEAIVVSVQSKDGSWCLVATFDRDEHGAPRSPSAPLASWNSESEGVYAKTQTYVCECGDVGRAGGGSPFCHRSSQVAHGAPDPRTRHPVRPLVVRGGWWREHRVLETGAWILTERCAGVSASPEHNAVAARYRLWRMGKLLV